MIKKFKANKQMIKREKIAPMPRPPILTTLTCKIKRLSVVSLKLITFSTSIELIFNMYMKTIISF